MAGSFFPDNRVLTRSIHVQVALKFQISSPPFPAAAHLTSVPHNSSERSLYATLWESTICSVCFLQHSQPEQRSEGAGWKPEREMRVSELDHSLARGHHHLTHGPQ